MDLADTTGIGGTIELDGETYLLSQPTIEDAGAVKAWLRERMKHPMTTAREGMNILMPVEEEPEEPKPPKNVKDMTTDEQVAFYQVVAMYKREHRIWKLRQADYKEARDTMLLHAMKQVDMGDKRVVDAEYSDSLLSSEDGVAFMLWLSLKHRHPEVMLTAASKMVKQAGAQYVRGKMDKSFAIPEELLLELENADPQTAKRLLTEWLEKKQAAEPVGPKSS